jgi:hypothetical protein
MADNGDSAQSQFQKVLIYRPMRYESNELCVVSIQSAIGVTIADEAILPELLLSILMPIDRNCCGSTYVQVIFHVAISYRSCPEQ